MMRISVTDLDSFRYFQESDMTLDEFLARLRREEPPTQAMLAGRALHKALELLQGDFDVPVMECDGHTFIFDAEIEMTLPRVRELKGEMQVSTPYGMATLVGVVDGIDGLTVRDYKLTERFDAERYIDSTQWRAYLTMFAADAFDYEVFIGREVGDKRYAISDHQRLRVNRYAGMEDEVKRAVCEFAGFLAQYVPERIAA